MADCLAEFFRLIILDLPSWVTVFLTGVIAAATIAYVVLTKKLWHETQRSAEAAMKSAEAAKKSAELAAALHRPFMGLLKVTHTSGWGTDMWVITLVLKNYGTLPALNVGAMMDFFAGNSRFVQMTEPTSVQIFPSDEVETIARLNMPTQRVQIQQGAEKLRIEVRIPYQAEGGRHSEYTAEVSYMEASSTARGRFVIDKSETH